MWEHFWTLQSFFLQEHILNAHFFYIFWLSKKFRVFGARPIIKMILAHIFLPAMLLVICKTQQAPAHIANAIGNEENVFNDSPASETSNATELLERYRQLVAKSLLKLYDSCRVHDFLQNLKRDMENDMSEYCCITCPL